MLVHLYDAGPVLKQDVQQLGYINSSIPHLHPRSQHADRGSTMLTQLHEAGWCLVDFFKPADILVIQGTAKSGGGGVSAFIRDNTVYTQTERLSHLEPSRLQMQICYLYYLIMWLDII